MQDLTSDVRLVPLEGLRDGLQGDVGFHRDLPAEVPELSAHECTGLSPTNGPRLVRDLLIDLVTRLRADDRSGR